MTQAIDRIRVPVDGAKSCDIVDSMSAFDIIDTLVIATVATSRHRGRWR